MTIKRATYSSEQNHSVSNAWIIHLLLFFKEEIEKALLHSVDKKMLLVVETDASDTAITATLNQANCPVAFFSCTLTTTEQKHSSVEKEACAIVESVKKWSHYLYQHDVL